MAGPCADDGHSLSLPQNRTFLLCRDTPASTARPGSRPRGETPRIRPGFRVSAFWMCTCLVVLASGWVASEPEIDTTRDFDQPEFHGILYGVGKVPTADPSEAMR